MKLDRERAISAIDEAVAGPLGLSIDRAVSVMEDAWVGKVADSIKAYDGDRGDTVLAAFGGAGPFAVCRIADQVGIDRILIPGLAPVFSAFGLAFSDVAHVYAAPLHGRQVSDVQGCREGLVERARRGMFAEGATLDVGRIEEVLTFTDATGEQSLPFSGDMLPVGLPAHALPGHCFHELANPYTGSRTRPQGLVRTDLRSSKRPSSPAGSMLDGGSRSMRPGIFP